MNRLQIPSLLFQSEPFPTPIAILFKNISHPESLQKAIKSGSDIPQGCYLDASKLLSIDVLRMALLNAFVKLAANHLKTKSIYSEILYALSPGTSILDAFKEFGVSKKTNHVLFITLESQENAMEKLTQITGAEPVHDLDLSSITDIQAIQKIFKLEKRLSVDQMQRAIVSRITLKDL